MININNRNLCEYCFAKIDQEPCPKCGFSRVKYKKNFSDLEVGSVLKDHYVIGGVIGKGGFGITYLAYDRNLERKVAIKEYYPNGLAVRNIGSTIVSAVNEESAETFQGGADKFYDEARLMAKFNDNPNIVSVYDCFYGNDTVYFTMGFLRGQTLKEYIKEHGVLSSGQTVCVAGDIANALIAAHHLNVLHRDISPDNIMVCSDGTVKLLDFGAARQVLTEGSQSLSVILKQGFAPLEQYQTKGKQGPWTDIYALGATLYYALTLDLPDDPMSRLEDDRKYSSNIHGIEEPLWEIIQKATMLKASERYHDIYELKTALDSLSIQPVRLTIPLEAVNDIKFEETVQPKPQPVPEPEPSSEQKNAGTVGKTIPFVDIGETMPVPDPVPAPDPVPIPDPVPEPEPWWLVFVRKNKKRVIAAGICVLVLLAGGSVWYYFGKNNEPQEGFELTATATPGAIADNQQEESSYEIFAYDGGHYEGVAMDGKPYGAGKLTWGNGNVYEGGFKDGQKEGTGTYTWKNGDTYVGEWKDDKRTGTGTFTWASGDTYTGEFKDGKMNGTGKYTYPSGDVYEGEYKDGKMNGTGTYTWKNGETYTGEWRDDKMNGTGKRTYFRAVYEGEFKDGKRNGTGTYTSWFDNTIYTGEWKDDKWNGTGTYTWWRGKYTGKWKDGEKNGTGIFTDNNGKKYRQKWKNGKMVSSYLK